MSRSCKQSDNGEKKQGQGKEWKERNGTPAKKATGNGKGSHVKPTASKRGQKPPASAVVAQGANADRGLRYER
jgi:hypothetical protein